MKIAVTGHARHLDGVAQLKLAPPAALVGPTQGRYEAMRLAVELGVRGGDVGDLFVELGVRLDPFRFERLDGVVLFLEEVVDRLDRRVDREPLLFSVAAGDREETLERLGGRG